MGQGFDISEHQGQIDFEQLGKQADFLIIREGYRQKRDSRFLEYVKGAMQYGIPIVGVYHFIYATNTADAIAEARSCVAGVLQAGLPGDITIWADLEYDTVTKAKAIGITLTPQMQKEITIAFCKEIQRQGYPTGIYANIDYLRNVYGTNITEQFDIWLADWTGTNDYPCVYQQTGDKGWALGISGNVDTDKWIGDFTAGTAKPKATKEETEKVGGDNMSQRQKIVVQAQSWLGRKEADGTHRAIIDVYNAHLAEAVKRWGTRNVRMQYDWAWCACFTSACAMATGLTDVVPCEIACDYIVQEAQRAGIWIENDAYVPKPGDLILYDWQDSGTGDNQGQTDHVGLVEKVVGSLITVIEGNCSDMVMRRNIAVNARYIRGFVVPKYDTDGTETVPVKTDKTIEQLAQEVLAGKWGTGIDRKNRLTNAGYDYAAIQAKVNAIIKEQQAAQQKPVTVEEPKTGDTFSLSFPVVRNGSVSGYVAVVQAILVHRGYSVGRYGCDGEYGNDTEAAVKKFQAANGLSASGVVDKETLKRLSRV